MNKIRAIKKAAIVFLLTSSFSHAALADSDEDFSTVDCNKPKVRAMLLESYNEIKSNSNAPTVIDVYDQKTVNVGLNKLTCHGTYEFSDGDKVSMTYDLYKNSLGQFINSFEPDSIN